MFWKSIELVFAQRWEWATCHSTVLSKVVSFVLCPCHTKEKGANGRPGQAPTLRTESAPWCWAGGEGGGDLAKGCVCPRSQLRSKADSPGSGFPQASLAPVGTPGF